MLEPSKGLNKGVNGFSAWCPNTHGRPEVVMSVAEASYTRKKHEKHSPDENLLTARPVVLRAGKIILAVDIKCEEVKSRIHGDTRGCKNCVEGRKAKESDGGEQACHCGKLIKLREKAKVWYKKCLITSYQNFTRIM